MSEEGQPGSVPVSISVSHRSSLGIASIILGSVAFPICWIPVLGMIGTPLSAVGLLLGFVGLVVSIVRRGGVGYPIAGLVISGVALGVAVWLGVVASLIKRHDAAADSITPADRVFEADGLELRISGVTIGKVKLRDDYGGDPINSIEAFLSISVELRNATKTRKIEYTSFRGADLLCERVASLRDGFGNSYRQITFGIGKYPAGGVRSESIYPSKAVTDVLVFERPLAAVEHIDLALPLSDVGGKGTVCFRIPRSMIPDLAAK